MSKEINVLLTKMVTRTGFGMALAMSLFTSMPAQAEDAEGCKDNQIIGRFTGATIAYCKVKEFDELAFMRAAVNYGALLERNATTDKSGPEWAKLQGKATELRYELPSNRSSLEVMANYKSELSTKGFQILFECNDQDCLSGTFRDLYVMGELLDPSNGISTAYFDHARYIFAEKKAGGSVHASILVGEVKDAGVAFLRVLEEKPMDANQVQVPQATAEDLSASLAAAGSANVYGILFDYDQDAVKPESKPALDEIAAVLNGNPVLLLKVIGHTDNVGGEAYNLDLSSRRAANVSAALVGGYGIDPARLTFEGAGFSRPIESNDTEEGRAKNRRVELVAQ